MALWGDFGKHVGETARTFGNRAREVAETTKLNGQIAIRKTEAERLYADVGKAYCDARVGRKDCKGDVEALCLKIEALNAEIESLQAEIDEIRQVRRCKACGEVSSTNSRFCGACGAKFEEPQPAPNAEESAEPTTSEAPEDAEGVQITWPGVAPSSEPAPMQTESTIAAEPTQTAENTNENAGEEPTEK